MKLYVIRHGETDRNKEGVLQGWLDSPLNENGLKLAEITGEALADIKFDVVYTSPLKRAYQTAEAVVNNNKVYKPEIRIEERIKEISFGEWEGKEFKKEDAPIPRDEYMVFINDPMHFEGAPGGEAISSLLARSKDFFDELISREDLRDKNVLVSTHGCALRAFMHSVYDNKDSFWQDGVPANCAVSIVDVTDGETKLTQHDKIYYDPSMCVNVFNK